MLFLNMVCLTVASASSLPIERTGGSAVFVNVKLRAFFYTQIYYTVVHFDTMLAK
jgi:hypothetical protein